MNKIILGVTLTLFLIGCGSNSNGEGSPTPTPTKTPIKVQSDRPNQPKTDDVEHLPPAIPNL